jgi:hypothetical protein
VAFPRDSLTRHHSHVITKLDLDVFERHPSPYSQLTNRHQYLLAVLTSSVLTHHLTHQKRSSKPAVRVVSALLYQLQPLLALTRTLTDSLPISSVCIRAIRRLHCFELYIVRHRIVRGHSRNVQEGHRLTPLSPIYISSTISMTRKSGPSRRESFFLSF